MKGVALILLLAMSAYSLIDETPAANLIAESQKSDILIPTGNGMNIKVTVPDAPNKFLSAKHSAQKKSRQARKMRNDDDSGSSSSSSSSTSGNSSSSSSSSLPSEVDLDSIVPPEKLQQLIARLSEDLKNAENGETKVNADDLKKALSVLTFVADESSSSSSTSSGSESESESSNSSHHGHGNHSHSRDSSKSRSDRSRKLAKHGRSRAGKRFGRHLKHIRAAQKKIRAKLAKHRASRKLKKQERLLSDAPQPLIIN